MSAPATRPRSSAASHRRAGARPRRGSRGPIVDEPSLLAALGSRKLAGAGLDTFDVEPLPVSHPLRKLDNVVLTPHLGYVSQEGYKVYYTQMVDDIKAWLAGSPVRVLKK